MTPARGRDQGPARGPGRALERRTGRPRLFIAALVVARAAELFAKLRSWTAVLEQLEAEGNGTYARNTLRRHVEEYSGRRRRPKTG